MTNEVNNPPETSVPGTESQTSDEPWEDILSPEEWEEMKEDVRQMRRQTLGKAACCARALNLPHVTSFLEEELIFYDEWARWHIAETLAYLLELECDHRQDERLRQSVAAAALKYPRAVLDSRLDEPGRALDVKKIRELEECRWIYENENLLITGTTGAGKTYLACALAISAIRRGRTVQYLRTSDLLCQLRRADARGRLPEAATQLTRPDLLVLDNFSLTPLDSASCARLFDVVDGRSGVSSTVVVSARPVSEWPKVFADKVCAAATLDRLTRKAHFIEMNGPSLRCDGGPEEPSEELIANIRF